MPLPSRRPTPATRTPRRSLTALLGASVLAAALGAPAGSLAAKPQASDDPTGGLEPTVHYEDVLRHAGDRIHFEPGGRVTVGFTPRKGDRHLVGGREPLALPAGRLTGKEMRAQAAGASSPSTAPTLDPSPAASSSPSEAPQPTGDPTPAPTVEPTASPSGTAGPSAGASEAPSGTPATSPSAATSAAPSTDVPVADDGPVVDPASVIEADGATAVVEEPVAGPDLQASVSPAGLRKEVFGFLPYWELNDSTVLDWTKLSTVAFFGVGAAANGDLEKRDKDGDITVGWSGWTSSRMTGLINTAHRNNTRVVLTIQSFAWSTAGATKQKTLLGSSTARANLARQIAAAVRDRGADGVNLDFEPLAAGYGDEFVSLVRRIRTELDAVRKGYQLTFDTLGFIGNYPIEGATAPGGADAIFIMGYDYRNGGATRAGSIAPVGGTAYDIVDTIAAYTARVPASKLILGVPYYGRAWSTTSDQLNAENISGTKNGASTTVLYSTAVDYLRDRGRRWDSREGVAWTAYKRENCTDAYGCVTPWRQLYVDDATALKLKYDLINRYGLRGAGIWALGYDGSRPELWTAIRDKFITDSTAPTAGIRTLDASQSAERFEVRWASRDDFGVVSHDVDVSIDGGSWTRWMRGTKVTSAWYVGARGHTFAFRVRARDGKGNVSDWTGIPKGGSTTITTGAFGRIATDTLNARSGAGTSASIQTTLEAGDLVAFLQGPVAADGYTWYRVAAPVGEWPLVGSTRTDLWIATGSGGERWVNGVPAPNSTKVTSAASLAAADGGAEWYPVSPVRLLDTRTGNGLSGAFVDEKPRSFQLAGRGSVPADAVAVTANLTVTGATANGYVAIGPSMSAKPSTSTISVVKGQTIANGVTLRIGSGGTVGAVFMSAAGAKAQLVLDVTGFYRVGGTGATWYPLQPTRLLDTRSAAGLSGRFTAGKVRTLQIAGRGGIPADATGVTGNLTATGATRNGYVAIGPSMTSTPSTSTLSVRASRTTANNVTLRLGSGGKAGLVFVAASGTTTHLVFDVTGYYKQGNAGAEWYPVSPVRLLDTRSGNGLSGAFVDEKPRTFQLTGRGTVPVDAVAVTANLTVTGATANGYAAIGPSMSAKPSTSTLNVVKGQTIANGVTLRVGSGGKVGSVFMSASGAKAHEIVDLTGYFR